MVQQLFQHNIFDYVRTLTDVATGNVIWRTKAKGYGSSGNAFINDGSQIVSVDYQCANNVTVWDAKTGKQVARDGKLPRHRRAALCQLT